MQKPVLEVCENHHVLIGRFAFSWACRIQKQKTIFFGSKFFIRRSKLCLWCSSLPLSDRPAAACHPLEWFSKQNGKRLLFTARTFMIANLNSDATTTSQVFATLSPAEFQNDHPKRDKHLGSAVKCWSTTKARLRRSCSAGNIRRCQGPS